MCLAVPSKIIEMNNGVAKVDVDGVVREASLMLLDDSNIGDYVIVHAGFAISKVDEEAALQTLEDMRTILAADALDVNSPNRRI
ncbi:MAG: HypC/HybG/HupF family hydrogenase formation chaperone [Desulfobacula sp.]|nr:HypC/HybG/HupF family hydrogenase formation chaperone [Desulfobacula sp.]